MGGAAAETGAAVATSAGHSAMGSMLLAATATAAATAG
jgi:hypothetical protein